MAPIDNKRGGNMSMGDQNSPGLAIRVPRANFEPAVNLVR
jgi:hypothetical protein